MPPTDPTNLLAFWRACELLSPQPLARPDEDDATLTIPTPNTPLPWHPHHPLRERPLARRQTWQHVVFCTPFSLDRAFAAVRRSYPDADPYPDERPPAGEGAIAAFVVADDGRPILGSAVLASCAWAISHILHTGPASLATAAFEQNQHAFTQSWEELVEADEDDEQATHLARQGHPVGRVLELPDLEACNQLATELLNLDDLPDFPSEHNLRIASRIVPTRESHEPGEREILNSFFADDLRTVANALQHEHCGPALREYLTTHNNIDTSHRIDVETHLTHVRKNLQSRHIPPGRWPSNTNTTNGLGQQLAINTIIADKQHHLHAVNGPPGTGKTVTLRELLAATVVTRATHLAALATPTDAFEAPLNWNGGRRKLHPLHNKLTGHELILACTTNAAAENVTAEIPAREAIDLEPTTDYFSDIATQMLNPKDCNPPRPAWGLVAAVLGSKKRNKNFVSHFWWQGLKAHLEQPKPEPWEQAVERFNSAHRRVTELLEDRTRISDLREQLDSEEITRGLCEEQAEHARRDLQALDPEATRQQLTATAHNREQHARRLARHRIARPNFWRRLLTAADRDWRHLHATLTAHLATAQRAEREAIDTHAREQQSAEDLRADIQRHETAARAAADTIEELRETIPAALVAWQQAHPEAVVADEAWEQPTAREHRERQAPWLDPELNAARSDLFFAALHLHRAFLENAAKPMRENLACATELISGQAAKPSERQAQIAWQSLFLAVPLVSTTFASFAYLFRHLGSEALGHLLIDEAGQATPQSAVGALWRTKRAVVVGDPMQLEPIVQLPNSIERVLRSEHNVPNSHLREEPSVQTQADQSSHLGTHRGDGIDTTWVGVPLNTHRRCEEPMFAIVNEIAYEHQMINCTAPRPALQLPESHWIDVPDAPSTGNWVPAEGQALDELLQGLRYHMVNPADVFLITPFRDVARNIAHHRWTYPGLTTGTVHTAQGRESDIVILILGGSNRSPHARAWAAQKPNLLNVAISRARRRLYVIGDHAAWSRLPHFETLATRLPLSQPAAAASRPL
ncbi:MAG: DEAD/DEAH box helicase [Solirubrobacteraceae bacterium]